MHADRLLSTCVRAGYEARIADLEAEKAKLLSDLESLKAAHQELQQALKQIVQSERKDWSSGVVGKD